MVRLFWCDTKQQWLEQLVVEHTKGLVLSDKKKLDRCYLCLAIIIIPKTILNGIKCRNNIFNKNGYQAIIFTHYRYICPNLAII